MLWLRQVAAAAGVGELMESQVGSQQKFSLRGRVHILKQINKFYAMKKERILFGNDHT